MGNGIMKFLLVQRKKEIDKGKLGFGEIKINLSFVVVPGIFKYYYITINNLWDLIKTKKRNSTKMGR